MEIAYAFTPFLAWLVAGTLKFLINSIRVGEPAFGQIGYGGLPSNHSAVASSMAALIALREGMGQPAFGVAVTLAFIVMLDASSLRRQVGRQAAAINRLARNDKAIPQIRERMGHTPVEIGAGILVGMFVAWLVHGTLG